LLAACAPDAVNNRAGDGIQRLRQRRIARMCAAAARPLPAVRSPDGGAGNNSYNYWLDQTSRLYYRRIDAATYRESLKAFFGAGNDATISCIVSNLPANPS
jgi:hypothetical protein